MKPIAKNTNRQITQAIQPLFQALEERRLLTIAIAGQDDPMGYCGPVILVTKDPADDSGDDQSSDESSDDSSGDSFDDSSDGSSDDSSPADKAEKGDGETPVCYYFRTLTGQAGDDELDDGELEEGDPLENPDVIFYSLGGLASGATARLSDGVLTITGTDSDDKVCIHLKKNDASRLVIRFAGHRQTFAKADVTTIVADLMGGNDKLDAKRGIDIPIHAKGGDGNDLIVGGSGDDQLEGGPGNDKLAGKSGNDILLGQAGDDMLRGGADDDVLDGGTGEDGLRGDGGSDTNEDASDKMTDRATPDGKHRKSRKHQFALRKISSGQLGIRIGDEMGDDSADQKLPGDEGDDINDDEGDDNDDSGSDDSGTDDTGTDDTGTDDTGTDDTGEIHSIWWNGGNIDPDSPNVY